MPSTGSSRRPINSSPDPRDLGLRVLALCYADHFPDAELEAVRHGARPDDIGRDDTERDTKPHLRHERAFLGPAVDAEGRSRFRT
jgi:hypothetical protein